MEKDAKETDMLAIIFLIFYLLISYYTLRQVHYWTDQAFSEKGKTIKILFNIGFIVALSLPLLGTFLPESTNYYFMKAGNIWYGLYVYFGAFLVIAHLLRLTVHRFGGDSHVDMMNHHYTARGIFIFALIFCMILNTYGMINAKSVRKTSYNLSIDKSCNDENMKVVLIADLHLGPNSSRNHISRMVRLVNDEDPDMILVAGDFFSSSYDTLKDPDEYIEILKKLRSRYGTYAVYGNHDVAEKLVCGFAVSSYTEAKRDPRMSSFIRKCGMTILDDERVLLDNGIQLIGRRDYEKPGDGSKKQREDIKNLTFKLNSEYPVFCLEHEPNDFKKMEEAGVDLVLSGHTHDGQIFPGNIITGLIHENSYGLKDVAEPKKLYSVVTSGVGFYGVPIRVGTISEITVLDLKFTK